MSTLSQFGGLKPTRSIVNLHSSGGQSTGSLAAGGPNQGRSVSSGALTANTLATLLTVTGSGFCPVLSAYSIDGTARTIRLVVIVDGVTVFDATSASISVASTGIVAAGMVSSTGSFVHGQPIVFASSFVVRVASSLSETDKVAINYYLMGT